MRSSLYSTLLPTVLLAITISTVYSIKCTVCDFRSQPPYNSSCEDTCEGDVCFIVVNKYFNGTINAGCMHLRENDSFVDEAICKRGPHDNRCACSTKDFCNSPNATIATYVFTESDLLGQYQWVPQIQPPSPGVQPIFPPEDVHPSGGDMNVTATELENGVEDDLAHELENSHPVQHTEGRTTKILRNDENEGLLTVTTTIGLNARDHSQRINTSQNDVEDSDEETTMRSFTSGQGSVEVTKVTQEAQSPPVEISNRNLTTSDGSEENPNSSGKIGLILVTVLPILMQRFLMA